MIRGTQQLSRGSSSSAVLHQGDSGRLREASPTLFHALACPLKEVLKVSGALPRVLAVQDEERERLEKPLCSEGLAGFFWMIPESPGQVDGAEGGTRTPTGIAHCPLKTACLPVPPPRQSGGQANRIRNLPGGARGIGGFPLEFPRGATRLEGTEGVVAEWLGRGLQNLVQRFDPARHLQSCPTPGNPEKSHPTHSHPKVAGGLWERS